MFPVIMLSSYKVLEKERDKKREGKRVAKGLRKIASRTCIRSRGDSSARRSRSEFRSTPEYTEIGGRCSRGALGVPT